MATRSVLITGAARGIGKGIARSFLDAGYRVMLGDLAAETNWDYSLATDETMARTLDELSSVGEVHGVSLDVTRADSCERAVKATLDTFGQLDILINNAGVLDSGPVATFEEAAWDRIFSVNVKGIFLMTRAALPALKSSNDAAIINTSSIAGKRGVRNLSAYSSSKFAVIGLTQSMAQEFARKGIRVNALCPGIVGTAIWSDHLMANESTQAFEDHTSHMVPMGRPQTTEDMAQAALYLATAPNVTGVSLSVSGGFEMN